MERGSGLHYQDWFLVNCNRNACFAKGSGKSYSISALCIGISKKAGKTAREQQKEIAGMVSNKGTSICTGIIQFRLQV